MRIALVFNPIAGKGHARAAAESLAAPIRAAGHETLLEPTGLDLPEGIAGAAMQAAEALVVVGGDGAMRLMAAPAARAGKPIYPYPLGTENLFAREIGTRKDPDQLVAALRRFEVREIDMGEIASDPFLIMASIGFDASVVNDLARNRSGAIHHLSYLAPISRQLREWHPPTLRVTIDGEAVVEGTEGVIVVANSRQYAIRADPAVRASMTDGLLDVVFFPSRSVLSLFGWLAASLLGMHLESGEVVYRQGKHIVVQADPAQPYQLDGDAPREVEAVSELDIRVRPGALRVLVP